MPGMETAAYCWPGVLDEWQRRAQRRGVPHPHRLSLPGGAGGERGPAHGRGPGTGDFSGRLSLTAERRLWAFLPDWLEEETWQDGGGVPSRAPWRWRPRRGPVSPTWDCIRDSLMGLGLTREKLGDSLLLPTGGPGGGAAGRCCPFSRPSGRRWGGTRCGRPPSLWRSRAPSRGAKADSGHGGLPPAGRCGGGGVLHSPEPGRRS